ncbi:MAG: hypothetical protein KAU17_14880 [Spirochaetales bacterium]|nr:hypothetical protein [Spirochaetales bacterium]
MIDNNSRVPPRFHNSTSKVQAWEERLKQASHEYWRIRAHAELAQLGIPVTRYDPTTNDVPLAIKMEGGKIRTDFDPTTPLAQGRVIDISALKNPSMGDNPTITINGKLFLQLTMKDEDQKRLFSQYPRRNYIPIQEDSRMILEYQNSLDMISIGMHDYNPDNTHLWPGIPHSYLYAPPGSPYDPEKPPVIRGDGFPYIQRSHLTLARREVPMTNPQYIKLLEKIENLKGSGIVKVRYDMGNGLVESVAFEEIWLKINPYNGDPTHILKKVTLE